MDLFLYFIAGSIIFVGLGGVFIPFLPGVALIYCGILLASYTGGFSFISTMTLVILGILTVLSFAVDYASGVLGAKLSGASAGGVVGALLGTILGTAILGPIGILVGPAFGVLVFEYLYKKDVAHSLKLAKYTLVSTIVGLVINIFIALIMLGTFLGSIFF